MAELEPMDPGMQSESKPKNKGGRPRKNPVAAASSAPSPISPEANTQAQPEAPIDPMAAFAEMMVRMNKEIAKTVANEVAQALKPISQQSAEGRSRENALNQYDPEDALAEPVVFFYPGKKFIDYGCTRGNGSYHLPPFRDEHEKIIPIIFEFSHSTPKSGNAAVTEADNFCMYICKSKKELEYLRNHPLFNIMIFERTIKGEMRSSQYMKASLDALTMIRNLTIPDRMAMATAKGIDVSGANIDEITFHLVQIVVNENIKAQNADVPERVLSQMFPNSDFANKLNQTGSAATHALQNSAQGFPVNHFQIGGKK